MTKVLKCSIFIIFSFVASIFFASNVFAFTKGEYIGHDYYDTDKGKTGFSKAVTNSSISGTTNYYVYKHTTEYNNKDYLIYCLDVARKGGGSNAKLKVKRVLSQKNAKDAVILYIISSPNYSYEEKTIALRAFTPFNGDLASAQLTYYEKDRACANRNSGVSWASEDKTSLKAIFGTTSPSASNYSGCSSQKMNTSNYTVSEAKKLFKEALKEGAAVANGRTIKEKNVTYTAPDFVKNKYDIVYENDKMYGIRQITFTGTFTNFNDDEKKPVTIAITPDTKGAAIGTLYEYRVLGNQEWKTFNSSTNFLEFLTKDSVIIEFRITVKAQIVDASKFTINFKVDTKYEDPLKISGALLYNSKTDGTQRFYIYDKETTTHKPFEKSLQWDNIIGYCKNEKVDTNDTEKFKSYMKACCKGHNEPGFSIVDECDTALKNAKTQEERDKVLANNEFCKLKTKYCDVCNGTISVPQTCSEFGSGDTPRCEDNADAIVKDNDNVKLCILDYSDQADNTYQMTTDDNVASNDYCRVYCKEDYKISLPLGRWVTAGRSFALAMNVNASKTCYTDLIDYDKFARELAFEKSKLDANSSDTGARNRYKKILNQYKTCATASWNSDIKFEPTITLTYDEKEYIDKFKDKKVKFQIANKAKNGKEETTLNVSNNNIWLCSGNDTDDYYNECKNGTVVNKPEGQVTITLSGYYDPDNFGKTDLKIPVTKFAKKISFASAVYAPEDNLYTEAGSGVITTTSSNTNRKLSTSLLVNGEEITNVGQLPITLKREVGAYKFNIQFNNVGEYFDSGKTGRLIGGANAVALKDDKTTFKGEYVCSYTVNCPECKVGCHEDPTKGIFCSIGEQPQIPTCINCKINPIPPTYDGNELFITRQISLYDVNPSERKPGINLNTLKGRTAVNSIEGDGEKIYGNDFEPEYSITLTPSETRKLQQYNNLKLDSGGYSSLDDFDCDYYSNMVNKSSLTEDEYNILKKYDYIVCKSKLLDKSNSGEYTLRNIDISNVGNVSWIEACNKSKNTECIVGGFYGPAYK